MAENTSSNTVKSIEDVDSFVKQQIDPELENSLINKFNAATEASYKARRAQEVQAENAFYNKMYSTQRTALDTIRKSNADAVATGASRGMQAAQNLSAILGLEQEGTEEATNIANQAYKTAQEEAAERLQNIVNAGKQATEEAQVGVQAQSVNVTERQQKAEQYNALAANYAQAKADGNEQLAENYLHQMWGLEYDLNPETLDHGIASVSNSPDWVNAYNTQNNKLEALHTSGVIDDAKYTKLRAQLDAQEPTATRSTWRLEGLWSNDANEDIGLIMGGYRYELRAGPAVNNDTSAILNKVATGDTNKAPTPLNAEYADVWNGTENTDSDEAHSNSIVVYKGKMYGYTPNGWREFIRNADKHKDVNDLAGAVQTFLNRAKK